MHRHFCHGRAAPGTSPNARHMPERPDSWAFLYSRGMISWLKFFPHRSRMGGSRTRFKDFWRVLAVNRWAAPNDVAGLRTRAASIQLCTKGFGTMYWRVALLVLLIASVPHAKAEPADERALRLLNQYRQNAGLTPVKLDRQVSAGCMEHANYMAQNQGTDAMAELNPHTQRSNLPGASAAGAARAKASS